MNPHEACHEEHDHAAHAGHEVEHLHRHDEAEHEHVATAEQSITHTIIQSGNERCCDDPEHHHGHADATIHEKAQPVCCDNPEHHGDHAREDHHHKKEHPHEHAHRVEHKPDARPADHAEQSKRQAAHIERKPHASTADHAIPKKESAQNQETSAHHIAEELSRTISQATQRETVNAPATPPEQQQKQQQVQEIVQPISPAHIVTHEKPQPAVAEEIHQEQQAVPVVTTFHENAVVTEVDPLESFSEVTPLEPEGDPTDAISAPDNLETPSYTVPLPAVETFAPFLEVQEDLPLPVPMDEATVLYARTETHATETLLLFENPDNQTEVPASPSPEHETIQASHTLAKIVAERYTVSEEGVVIIPEANIAEVHETMSRLIETASQPAASKNPEILQAELIRLLVLLGYENPAQTFAMYIDRYGLDFAETMLARLLELLGQSRSYESLSTATPMQRISSGQVLARAVLPATTNPLGTIALMLLKVKGYLVQPPHRQALVHS